MISVNSSSDSLFDSPCQLGKEAYLCPNGYLGHWQPRGRHLMLSACFDQHWQCLIGTAAIAVWYISAKFLIFLASCFIFLTYSRFLTLPFSTPIFCHWVHFLSDRFVYRREYSPRISYELKVHYLSHNCKYVQRPCIESENITDLWNTLAQRERVKTLVAQSYVRCCIMLSILTRLSCTYLSAWWQHISMERLTSAEYSMEHHRVKC